MLEIKGLTKSFGNRKILDSLDLTLETGKIYALMGGNGAGKTTLFNLIFGYIKPDEGDIIFNNQKINKLSAWKINRLGIGRTFQDLRLITKLTVEENIRLSIKNNPTDYWLNALFLNSANFQKKSNTIIESIIKKFYLVDVKSHNANDISFGQQKLLTLACCTANDAQIMLLDEPVSGVQPLYREKIIELVQDLKRAGKTILLIEHHPEFLEKVADEYFFLSNGKITKFPTYQALKSDKNVLETYLG